MNLPNWLTVGRIAFTPLLVWLPLINDPGYRLAAFVLFVAVAVTDYYDGMLARTLGLVTDLGKMLDPLADKLLLLGTFVPMFYLMAPADDALLRLLLHVIPAREVTSHYPFVISFGEADFRLPFPWWVAFVVLGREVAMTIMRQVAARRGVVIAAIRAAKFKTVFQLIWIGAAYFWFFVATVDAADVRDRKGWDFLSNFTGIIGAIAMTASVVLTLWSLVVYLQRFGSVLTQRPASR
jgi:phosphatidylglycerophosphate synthase